MKKQTFINQKYGIKANGKSDIYKYKGVPFTRGYFMNSLADIESSFKGMVSSKEVSLDVIQDLKTYTDTLLASKDKLLVKKNLKEQFQLFYAIETINRVLTAMIERLPVAKKMHDNPTVAEDALELVPQIILIDKLLVEGAASSDYVFDLATNLQVSAIKSNMYPKSKEIHKSVNKSNLYKRFNSFAERVGENIDGS